jgi:hypothetical protein
VNARDEIGQTPLHFGTNYIYYFMFFNFYFTSYFLIEATEPSIIKILIENKAIVNAQDTKNITRLHYGINLFK